MKYTTKLIVEGLLDCLKGEEDKEKIYEAIIKSIDDMLGSVECFLFGQVVSDYLYDDGEKELKR